MTQRNESAEPPAGAAELQRVASLLGGRQILGNPPQDSLDAHELILRGLPGQALNHLVDNLVTLGRTASLEKAVGMSLRTFQRRREGSPKPLSQEQSGRTWKFAEILSRASGIFGSQAEAEFWLERPAVGLNQHRPIDLLGTPAGVEMVEDLLGRIEYGVYV